MARHTLVTVAPRTALITKSGFSNYDLCLNPYVGCEFKCQYCYVRFFVKDSKAEWGDFVRVREHMGTQLPKELLKGYVKVTDGKKKEVGADGTFLRDEEGKFIFKQTYKNLNITDSRLVIGTMTDPYQPKEVKYRIMRTALQTLVDKKYPQFKKVGIFTRSPLVLQDIDLIKQLPNPRVHFTVTPYHDEITRVLEPLTAPADVRWNVIRRLKEAGIRVHVNVAPVVPILSEHLIEKWVEILSDIAPAEYFVDPMQPYQESFSAFAQACTKIEGLDWTQVRDTMLDKDKYLEWKQQYRQRWESARKKLEHKCPDTLPIWCDHEFGTWVDMRTNKSMDNSRYGDEEDA